MLDFLQEFWTFFFSPLFLFDLDVGFYAVIGLCVIVLTVYVFVRSVLSWVLSF